jgi:hypothetical protein
MKPTSFLLKHPHSNGMYGFPCQTTFSVNVDKTVTVRTIMNDMGSDGMWEETLNATMSIEEARAMWRALAAYSWAPRT